MYFELTGDDCGLSENRNYLRVAKPCSMVAMSSDAIVITEATHPLVFEYLESGSVAINPADHAEFFAGGFTMVAVSFLIGISLNMIFKLVRT